MTSESILNIKRFQRMTSTKPEQQSADTWRVQSSTFDDIRYTVKVALARRFTHVDEIGASLDTSCNCPAFGDCKHAQAVRYQYNWDSSLLARLVGLPEVWTYTQLDNAVDAILRARAA